MIEYPTVLVLGAGASRPYGFPSGEELLREAVTELLQPASAWRGLLDACGFSWNVQEQVARELAGSGRYSIDAFLEGRAEYRPIGTTAIAAALIPRENWFTL